MSKVLVYVGVNKGFGLSRLLSTETFDIVYGFEPDPELFKIIQTMFAQYPFIKLINAACSVENSISDLFVTENRCSTSLATPNPVFFDKGSVEGISIIKTIRVNTINLLDFIKANNIDRIKYLVLDTQGYDYSILKTIEPLIENKKIDTIFTETHKNNCFLYNGIDNQFKKFKELLDKNYEIDYFSSDDIYISKEKNPEEHTPYNEWDTCWVLKKEWIKV